MYNPYFNYHRVQQRWCLIMVHILLRYVIYMYYSNTCIAKIIFHVYVYIGAYEKKTRGEEHTTPMQLIKVAI